MRHGALDYLVKPFEPGELPLVIERARRRGNPPRAGYRREDKSATRFISGRRWSRSKTQLNKILEADQRTRR